MITDNMGIQIVPVIDPNNENRFSALIDLDDSGELHHIRMFNINRYNTFSRVGGRDSWKAIKPLNNFLRSLDDKESVELANMFVNVKYMIDTLVNRRYLILDQLKIVDQMISESFSKLGLIQKIDEYVRNNYHPLLTTDLELSQEPNMVFTAEEHHELLKLMMVSKLLFPIFGELLHKIHKINPSLGNLKVSTIMNTLIYNHFTVISIKLLNYIERISQYDPTASTMNRVVDPQCVFIRGIENLTVIDLLARLVIKNMVRFEPTPDENIVKFIGAVIRLSVR